MIGVHADLPPRSDTSHAHAHAQTTRAKLSCHHLVDNAIKLLFSAASAI
jgi:hypothetical protein